MSSTLSLTTRSRHIEISAVFFVAGWSALLEYSDLKHTQRKHRTLIEHALPIFAADKTAIMTNQFISVETLCRILANAADWALDEDVEFFERNNRTLSIISPNFACLNIQPIEEWQQLSIIERKNLEELADSLLFACLVAHGQSQQ